MPTAVSVAVIVLVFGALLIFSWQQFRAGGRWGQRPSAQRAVPLGGVLFLSGFLLGVAGCRRPQPSPGGGSPRPGSSSNGAGSCARRGVPSPQDVGVCEVANLAPGAHPRQGRPVNRAASRDDVAWPDVWSDVARRLAAHPTAGRGHLLTEDVVRMETVLALGSAGVQARRLAFEHVAPELAGGKLDLVLDPPDGAVVEVATRLAYSLLPRHDDARSVGPKSDWW